MAGDGKPYFQETWFEGAFLAACFLILFILFYGLMPTVDINPSVIQTVAMGKLFAAGRFLEAFSRFNLPPIYPILLAIIIKIKHSVELPRLISAFQMLNLGMAMISVVLVHLFVRRQMPKPYVFIITGLYALAPSTLAMAWPMSPHMTYMVTSMGCLLAIDIALSRDSVLGGELSRGEIILCGGTLALSILSWQAGYLILLAFLFVMLKRFGLKRSVTIIAGIMLCISPFIGRDVFYVVRTPNPYIQPSLAIIRTISHRGVFRTLETYSDNIMASLADHAVGDLNLTSLDRIAHTPQRNRDSRIDITGQTWLRWLIGLVAIVGAVYGLSVYTGIGSLYMCTYVFASLALLPDAGLILAPVLPLLLIYLFYGLLQTGQWMHRLEMPLIARIAIPALTVWILLCTLTSHLSHLRGGETTRIGDMALHLSPTPSHAPKVMYMNTASDTEGRLGEAQKVSAHRRAMNWLGAHTPQNSRVAVPRPEAASRLVRDQDASDSRKKKQAIHDELSQYDYLVEEDAAKITHAKAAAGNGLKLVYEDVPGRIRIWRVQSSAE